MAFVMMALCGFLLLFGRNRRRALYTLVGYVRTTAGRLRSTFQSRLTSVLNVTSSTAKPTASLLPSPPSTEDWAASAPDNSISHPQLEEYAEQAVYVDADLPEGFFDEGRDLATSGAAMTMTHQAANADDSEQDRELAALEAELAELRSNGIACTDAPPAYV